MYKGPKLTIITACYNAEKTIEQTIQSVIKQTYENIEYIIVDGASTDGTMKIVEKYRKHIDKIESKSDKGVYDAFNKGVNISSGQYIYFLNADDYLLHSSVLSEVAKEIEQKEYPVVLYGGVIIQNHATGYVYESLGYVSLLDISKGRMIPHQAIFTQRDKIIEMGGFDLHYKIAADFLLIAKLYKKYETEFSYFSCLIANYSDDGISSRLSNIPIREQEYNNITQSIFESDFQSSNSLTNEKLYKKWIESIVFHHGGLGQLLKEKSITSVALFGSGELSNIIAKDFMNNGIEVKAFLDNNAKRQTVTLNEVNVVSPIWLKENCNQIESIIFGFEGNHETEVMNQLKEYHLPNSIQIYSWRELVAML